MREAADQMIATGMADYGYQFVNIDDCWMMKLKSKNPDISGKRRNHDNQMTLYYFKNRGD